MIAIDGVNDKGEAVRILIDGGSAQAIYSDSLADTFASLGKVSVERASHVEWDLVLGGWTADMRPSGGPILPDHDSGATFPTRQAALDAERAWLRAHKGL